MNGGFQPTTGGFLGNRATSANAGGPTGSDGGGFNSGFGRPRATSVAQNPSSSGLNPRGFGVNPSGFPAASIPIGSTGGGRGAGGGAFLTPPSGFAAAAASIGSTGGGRGAVAGAFPTPSSGLAAAAASFSSSRESRGAGAFPTSSGGFAAGAPSFGSTGGGHGAGAGGFASSSGGFNSSAARPNSFAGVFASGKSSNNTPFGPSTDKQMSSNSNDTSRNFNDPKGGAFSSRGILPFAASNTGGRGNQATMRTSPIAADENRNIVSDKPKTSPFNPFQQQQQQQTPQQQQQQHFDQTPQAPLPIQRTADKERELREMLQKKRQDLIEMVAERDRMMLRIDNTPKPSNTFTATDQPVNTASANQNIVNDSNLRVGADDMMENADDDEDGDGDARDDDNWMGDAEENEDGDGDEAEDEADNSLNISNTSDNRPSLQPSSLTSYQSNPIPIPTSIPTPLPPGPGPGRTPTRDLPSSSSSKGSCEGMCPLQERRQRIEENDVHKLEYPSAVTVREDLDPFETESTMVKKFQRSSADHELRIPHLLRTVGALYRTITYMEDSVMERHLAAHTGDRDKVTALFVYLFVWDRYRMVAKDFTLQISALRKDGVWVECHERMARWFVLMDHHMKHESDFVGGHAQQNGEQLNNLLKTLDGYYKNSNLKNTPMPNKGEFVGYFIIFQLGNGGEVTKYLQQVEESALSSPQVQFALKVWGALKTDDYAKFFKLLRSADLLQACLLHRYVGQVRLTAIRHMARGFFSGGGSETYYPLSDLIFNLMFEDEEDATEFLTHCGFAIAPADDVSEGPCVVLTNHNIADSLPTDKNGHPIAPSVNPMTIGIESKRTKNNWSISDICRGKASGGTPYHPPSDLLVAHTQIPKGYEKKPPSIIIRDSNSSPFLSSVYPDVKPAGSGTGWTSQAFAPDNSSGGICSQLPLQPSRKFLAKSQPAVTENNFSPPANAAAPSGGFSHSSERKEQERAEEDDTDGVFNQLNSADIVKEKLFKDKMLQSRKRNDVNGSDDPQELDRAKALEKERLKQMKVESDRIIEKQKEKENERLAKIEKDNQLAIKRKEEIEKARIAEKEKEEKIRREKEMEAQKEREKEKERMKEIEREKERVKQLEIENENKRKMEQRRLEEKNREEAHRLEIKQRKLDQIRVEVENKMSTAYLRRVMASWTDCHRKRHEENKIKTVKLFFSIWRRLQYQKDVNRNRLISEMSSIDISGLAIPSLGFKHKVHLSRSPRHKNTTEDSIKKRRISVGYRGTGSVGSDLGSVIPDSADRLFNDSCSLVAVRNWMVGSEAVMREGREEEKEKEMERCSVESLLRTHPDNLSGTFLRERAKEKASQECSSSYPPSPSFSSSTHIRTDLGSDVHLDLPALVCAALFCTQSGAVRALHGYSDITIIDPSKENGPLWGENGRDGSHGQNRPELFFKLAVCTGCTASRTWCDEEDFSVNMFRSVLTRSENITTGGREGETFGIGEVQDPSMGGGDRKRGSTVYFSRKYVSCHRQRTGEEELRYTSVCVSDMCHSGDASTPNNSNSNSNSGGKNSKSKKGKSSARSDTQGTQAALIVVPAEGWTDATGMLSSNMTAVLDALCGAISSGIPLGLIVTRERGMSLASPPTTSQSSSTSLSGSLNVPPLTVKPIVGHSILSPSVSLSSSHSSSSSSSSSSPLPSTSYTLSPSILNTLPSVRTARTVSVSWTDIPLGKLNDAQFTHDNNRNSSNNNGNSSNYNTAFSSSSEDPAYVICRTMRSLEKLFRTTHTHSEYLDMDLFQNLRSTVLFDMTVHDPSPIAESQIEIEVGGISGERVETLERLNLKSLFTEGSFVYASKQHEAQQQEQKKRNRNRNRNDNRNKGDKNGLGQSKTLDLINSKYTTITRQSNNRIAIDKLKAALVREYVGCLSAVVQRLAECASPFPVLRRVLPVQWLGCEIFKRLRTTPPPSSLCSLPLSLPLPSSPAFSPLLQSRLHTPSTTTSFSSPNGRQSNTPRSSLDVSLSLLNAFISLVNKSTQHCIESVHESAAKSMVCHPTTDPHRESFRTFPAAEFSSDFSFNLKYSDSDVNIRTGDNTTQKRKVTASALGVKGALCDTSPSSTSTSSDLQDENMDRGDAMGTPGFNFLPPNWGDKDTYSTAASRLQQLMLPTATSTHTSFPLTSSPNTHTAEASDRRAQHTGGAHSVHTSGDVENKNVLFSIVSKYFRDLGSAGWNVSESTATQVAVLLHSAATSIIIAAESADEGVDGAGRDGREIRNGPDTVRISERGTGTVEFQNSRESGAGQYNVGGMDSGGKLVEEMNGESYGEREWESGRRGDEEIRRTSTGRRKQTMSADTILSSGWGRALWEIVKTRIDSWPHLNPVYLFVPGNETLRAGIEPLTINGFTLRSYDVNVGDGGERREFAKLRAEEEFERQARKRRNSDLLLRNHTNDEDDHVMSAGEITNCDDFINELKRNQNNGDYKRKKEESGKDDGAAEENTILLEILGSMDAERKASDELASILQNALLNPGTLIDALEVKSHQNESVTDQEINIFLSKCNDDREKSNKMYSVAEGVKQQYMQK